MRRVWIAVVAAFATGLLVAYGVNRARAYGVPTTNTLAYSGTLLTFGAPDNSTHLMSLALYPSSSSSSVCSTSPASVQVINGQFTIPLGAACVTAVHQNQNLQVQVTIDSTVMGLTSLTAVPYALEADTASNAAPSFLLSSGSTVSRPPGVNGTIRFNTDYGGYEIFSNGFWFRQEPMLLSDGARTKVVFGYTGADQTFTVPSGVQYVFAKVWGAGGAGGTPGGWSWGAAGGGGGHSRGIIPVSGIPTLRIVVGEGGIVNQAVGAYGYGGGASAAQVSGDNRYAGGGGGYSGIFNGSTPLVVAGGGGGGGSSTGWRDGDNGGAGGGVTGQKGESPYWTGYNGTPIPTGSNLYSYGGNPGTQTAGGAGVNGCCSCSSLSGTQYRGGLGPCDSYGGGGGGGYWGGGGGGIAEPGYGGAMAGGGGGSGYIAAGTMFAVTMTGDGRSPANNQDPDLTQTGESGTILAHGGLEFGSGADGYVVLYY